MKKNVLSLLLAGIMVFSLVACKSGQSADSEQESENSGNGTSEQAAETGGTSEGKTDLVIIITGTDEVCPVIEQMVLDKFGDKYNITSKTWDESAVEQTVKTAASAGEQIDLVQYWPNQMNSFTSAGLAMELTGYMDDEWRETFNEGALEIGTYDGILYNVSYNSVYPMIIANTDILEEAGVTISNQPTWDEFIEACKQVEENTDAYGAIINQDWSCWLVRNGIMQAWADDEKLDAFNAGAISFEDPKIIAQLDMIADAFNNDIFYPGGEAALAVPLDQTYAAFSANKAAFLFMVNTVTNDALKSSEIENYQIIDWPAMGTNPTNPLLGGCDGYFIPTCAQNVDGAIELMRYLTSPEVLTVRAEYGMIPTAEIGDSENINQELMESISRCVSQVYPTEIINIDADLAQYLMYSMPANYIYDKDSAIEEMETYRKNAVGE